MSISSSELEKIPNLIEYYLGNGKYNAKEIAKNARNFALEYLSPDRIDLFCRMILEKYAKLYKDEIKVDHSYRIRNGFEPYEPNFF